MHRKIFVIIPAYYAEDTVGDVVTRVRAEGYQNVIVVNDGSDDKTSIVAKKAGAVVLHHICNRGYGAALRTGYAYAKRKDADFVVTLDADGQHNPKEIKDLIKPLLENRADIVLGSRFLHQKSNVPFIRKLFLKVGITVVYLFYGLLLTDSHNGFRAFNRHALERMHFANDDMTHSSEYPAEIRRRRLRYVEVPVTITYSDLSMARGQRTWNAFRIFFNMLYDKLTR